MRQAFKDEARAFIEFAAYDDGFLETLLTSNKTFVNDDLARVYGIDAPGTDAIGSTPFVFAQSIFGSPVAGSISKVRSPSFAKRLLRRTQRSSGTAPSTPRPASG